MKIELNNITKKLYNKCRINELEGHIIIYNIQGSIGFSFIYKYSNHLEKIGGIPSKHIFSKYIFNEISHEDISLSNNSIIIYSFKCSRGIKRNILISIGERRLTKILGKGILGSTIYRSILNGIYIGGNSYRVLKKVSFKSDIKSLVKNFKPVVIKVSDTDVREIFRDNIKYLDKVSFYEDIYYNKYGFRTHILFRNFLRFNIRGKVISDHRYGYIIMDNYQYPFIEIKSQVRDNSSLSNGYDVFIVRDLKYLDNILNPPYIFIDIEKDLNHIYFGDIFG